MLVIEQWDGADWNVAMFFGHHGSELTFVAVDPATVGCELASVIVQQVPVEFPDLGPAWVRLCDIANQQRPCSTAALIGS